MSGYQIWRDPGAHPGSSRLQIYVGMWDSYTMLLQAEGRETLPCSYMGKQWEWETLGLGKQAGLVHQLG